MQSTIIHVNQVTVQRNGKAILNDINWRVERGQHWAVIGANGAGKSTLLNVLNGYLWPTRGQVQVLGERYGHTNIQDVRKRIGWVSVATADTLVESHPGETAVRIVVGGKYASIGLWQQPSAADLNEALAMLDAFQAGELAAQPFHTLSQGERQRVLLARAWMAHPDLLVLDEPCTGLDIRARERLLSALEQRAAAPDAPTLLYVTHHPEEVLPFYTHALVLKDGRVLAQGRKFDVLTASILSEALDLTVDVVWQSGRPWVHVL
ncbi:putative ABC transporter ATP-binding protein YlmA [Alicyclobacillus contaminans]|uniref:ABC transporter ATP-binding protein n=1 Tax=Alicyclobacillus contaminans TaxID=392016 RepID=UPI00040EAB20|nr:ABC transporter ATP-binding protein [Alicyclobacillus contaminans]GMA49805.1 putative ABC transporter ATP-binding protein YlmA [Alicyclobacillus contaminans]